MKFKHRVAENIKIKDTLSVKVIRNPKVVIALVWLIFFVLVFLCLVFVVQKSIESIVENKNIEIIENYLLISLILVIILLFLILIAIGYGRINLLKIIAHWFNIPYE